MALVATDWKSPAEVDEGALRATRYDGSSPNGPLFVTLVGPNGSAIYVAPSQIVAVIGSPGVRACPTTLITMSQPVYVCESLAEVKRKLEAVK
jgi:hypothetical protein